MSKIHKIKEVAALKKHVGLIHSGAPLSLLQRKIANVLLYNAYNDLLFKDEHVITIKQLCSLIDYTSNDHKTVKNALIKLLSTVIEWNLLDKSEERVQEIWNASSLLSDASIKGPVCTYSYSKKMRELLYMPEMYGRVSLTIQKRFKSSYALALYENCSRYRNLPNTPWLDFMIFRKLMGVTENKYTIFRDFKKRVLDISIREVNELSDINVKPEFMKDSGKINFIRFNLTRQIDSIENQAESQKIVTPLAILDILVNEFKLDHEVANSLLKEYGEEKILQKINYVKSTVNYKSNKIPNISGYLIDAIKRDFKKFTLDEILVKNSNQKKTNSDKLNKDIKRINLDDIILIFNNLSIKNKQLISKEFEDTILNDSQKSYFKKHGLCNTMLAEDFTRYILKNRPELLKI